MGPGAVAARGRRRGTSCLFMFCAWTVVIIFIYMGPFLVYMFMSSFVCMFSRIKMFYVLGISSCLLLSFGYSSRGPFTKSLLFIKMLFLNYSISCIWYSYCFALVSEVFYGLCLLDGFLDCSYVI